MLSAYDLATQQPSRAALLTSVVDQNIDPPSQELSSLLDLVADVGDISEVAYG